MTPLERAAEAMSAADDAAFDPECPSPCFPLLARVAVLAYLDAVIEECRSEERRWNGLQALRDEVAQ